MPFIEVLSHFPTRRPPEPERVREPRGRAELRRVRARRSGFLTPSLDYSVCCCLKLVIPGSMYWATGLHLYTPLPFRPGRDGYGDLFKY